MHGMPYFWNNWLFRCVQMFRIWLISKLISYGQWLASWSQSPLKVIFWLRPPSGGLKSMGGGRKQQEMQKIMVSFGPYLNRILNCRSSSYQSTSTTTALSVKAFGVIACGGHRMRPKIADWPLHIWNGSTAASESSLFCKSSRCHICSSHARKQGFMLLPWKVLVRSRVVHFLK